MEPSYYGMGSAVVPLIHTLCHGLSLLQLHGFDKTSNSQIPSVAILLRFFSLILN